MCTQSLMSYPFPSLLVPCVICTAGILCAVRPRRTMTELCVDRAENRMLPGLCRVLSVPPSSASWRSSQRILYKAAPLRWEGDSQPNVPAGCHECLQPPLWSNTIILIILKPLLHQFSTACVLICQTHRGLLIKYPYIKISAAEAEMLKTRSELLLSKLHCVGTRQ